MKHKSALVKLALTMSIVWLAGFSCATGPDAYRDLDTAVSVGNFQGGVEAIRIAQESSKPMYKKNNEISLFLDTGMLEYYAERPSESIQRLQEAERLIEEAFTKSVSEDIASYIANDNTKEYAGEDFEDIYINIFNAINYYKQGNSEDAMVEIRKLLLSNGKLDMLSRKYEAGNKKMSNWLMENLAKIGFNLNASLPQGESMAFSNSALAQYLGALFFLANGNADSARIAFDAVGKAFAANPGIYYHPLPRAVEEARNVPPQMARLNIIAFAGLGPIKEEKRFVDNWPFMQNVELIQPAFKLPVLVDRDKENHQVTVSVNGKTFNLELIEDMGAVTKETYKAKFSALFLKTWIRVMMKYAAADITATALGKSKGGALARLATITAALVAVEASEAADIRMGRYFPNKAFIGGINLEPGEYEVTVTFSSGAVKKMKVNVKAGAVNLIDATSLTRNAQPETAEIAVPVVAGTTAPATTGTTESATAGTTESATAGTTAPATAGTDNNQGLVSSTAPVDTKAEEIDTVPEIPQQKLVDIASIKGVSPPVTGKIPVTEIIETEQYSGTVTWSPEVLETFEPGIRYTATITLTPKDDYTLEGVWANFFKVAWASSSCDADSGVITAVFATTKYPEDEKLWTVGASLGTSFAAPLFIGTVRGTVAPFSGSFFDLGLDIGLGINVENVEYFSLYPFVNYALFVPFARTESGKRGGFYAGAGFGIMFANYIFDFAGPIWDNNFAVNLIIGINIFDMFDISYTLRTNFTSANNKLSVGYVYRFK